MSYLKWVWEPSCCGELLELLIVCSSTSIGWCCVPCLLIWTQCAKITYHGQSSYKRGAICLWGSKRGTLFAWNPENGQTSHSCSAKTCPLSYLGENLAFLFVLRTSHAKPTFTNGQSSCCVGARELHWTKSVQDHGHATVVPNESEPCVVRTTCWQRYTFEKLWCTTQRS